MARAIALVATPTTRFAAPMAEAVRSAIVLGSALALMLAGRVLPLL